MCGVVGAPCDLYGVIVTENVHVWWASAANVEAGAGGGDGFFAGFAGASRRGRLLLGAPCTPHSRKPRRSTVLISAPDMLDAVTDLEAESDAPIVLWRKVGERVNCADR